MAFETWTPGWTWSPDPAGLDGRTLKSSVLGGGSMMKGSRGYRVTRLEWRWRRRGRERSMDTMNVFQNKA